MTLSVWALLFSFFAPGTEFDIIERALSAGNYRGALEQLSTFASRDARWHILASRAWDGLNDPAKAIAEAEEALKLEPGKPGYHVHLAQIFLSRNTPKAALEILTEADSQFPNVFVIRLGKGLALKELQRYEDAEHELHVVSYEASRVTPGVRRAGNDVYPTIAIRGCPQASD